jgi:hypothetical protein
LAQALLAILFPSPSTYEELPGASRVDDDPLTVQQLNEMSDAEVEVMMRERLHAN